MCARNGNILSPADLLEDIDNIEASVFGLTGGDEISDEEGDKSSLEWTGSDGEDEDITEHLEGVSNDDSADGEELSVDGDGDEVEVEEWTGFETEPIISEDEEKDESVEDQAVPVENSPAGTQLALFLVRWCSY